VGGDADKRCRLGQPAGSRRAVEVERRASSSALAFDLPAGRIFEPPPAPPGSAFSTAMPPSAKLSVARRTAKLKEWGLSGAPRPQIEAKVREEGMTDAWTWES